MKETARLVGFVGALLALFASVLSALLFCEQTLGWQSKRILGTWLAPFFDPFATFFGIVVICGVSVGLSRFSLLYEKHPLVQIGHALSLLLLAALAIYYLFGPVPASF